ncbi:uncharacterized protein [Amphiura filiformis]|uniref:uncharacterized protein n=1 Tax=Amphiura filiformis TaxID=82378 RepID=UPI003B20C44C
MATTFCALIKNATTEHESWNEMRTHISRHRGKFMFGSWKCNQEGCHQTFTRKLHLKRHVMFKHFYENVARLLAQEYSPASTTEDSQIKIKVMNTTPQSLKKFKKRSKAKKEKKSPSKKYLRCVKCNAEFKTMPDVDAHMERHIIRIKCTECEAYFDDEALLKNHVKENHSRMLHTNRCQLCSYSCLNSADLKTHMYSHENTVFECDLCGRVCANPKTLKSHRMRKHPDLFQNKNLVCIYCGMVFANDVLLQDHIRNKHKMRLNGQRRVNRREELKFPCNHCGFVANRQTSLQYHMRVHVENRPYKCTHCPYASKTRNNLILHIRTHKALAPLECPHCDFRGATNKVIQQHITSKHTNERPFKCTVCPWSTCYSGNLWKHMRMHKEKDGIEIPESTRKRNPRPRKNLVAKSTASMLDKGLPVTIYDGQIHVQQQQPQQQQIHLQPQQHQQQGTHIIHGGHQEVIQLQPRVQVQTQHQAENVMPQFAQVVLQAAEAPQHHQTVEIQIHGGEGGSMVIPRHGDDDMAAETVQQLVNLANMLPASSTGHVMHTMQPAHAQ